MPGCRTLPFWWHSERLPSTRPTSCAKIRAAYGASPRSAFFCWRGRSRASSSPAFGLPHLTGYLLAGIAAGPHALGIVDEHTVKSLSPVNTLALSLIALAGGAELELGAVRKWARSLVVATDTNGLSCSSWPP
jgi:hypothetical protein